MLRSLGIRAKILVVLAVPVIAVAAISIIMAVILGGGGALIALLAGVGIVVTDVSGIDAIEPGQILVTRQTDPGWATVFFLVRGLVIERGGMLSHGAIIAREYGIPAVIGIPGATIGLRSGQWLVVDGDQGRVQAHDSREVP